MGEKIKSAIRKITLNFATFKDEVVEPTKVNFFYGRNGVGKSTLARAIEKDQNIVWQEDGQACDVLVFGRDFVERNFETFGNIRGVFTLSEQNIAIQRQIEEKLSLKDEFDRQAAEYAEQIRQKETAVKDDERNFQEICWDRTREICAKFPEAVKGKGRKNLFANTVLSVSSPKEQDLEELSQLYTVAYDSASRTYNLFSRVSATPTYGKLPGRDLMDKVIVSSGKTTFANFIRALNASDWVRQGHQHYSGKAGGICPYCQQKLPADFEAQIAACFDEQYREDLNELRRFQQTYSRETGEIVAKLRANLSDPMPSLDLKEYEDKLSLLASSVKINEQRVAEKVKEPMSVVSLEDIDSLLIEIGQVIDEINVKIKANNDVVNARQRKKRECREAVWEHIAFILRAEVGTFRANTERLNREAEELKSKASQARKKSLQTSQEIAVLNRQTVSTRAAVDSINSLLKEADFQGFSLRGKNETAYEVVRENGSVAEELSEGEQNFIAFLYFYCMARGSLSRESILDKVVVIDDPVSGMDSNCVFIVGSLVREMISACIENSRFSVGKTDGGYIRQIFILTHDADFHNAISSRVAGRYESVSFYVIQKRDNISTIGSPKTRKNPQYPSRLENYNPVQNSYAELWGELRELDSPALLLNVMRTILEQFFISVCGYDGSDLRRLVLENHREDFISPADKDGGKAGSAKFDIASEILSHIGEPAGSGDGAALAEEYPDPSIYMETFKLIFIVLGQQRHYEMMMG